MSYLASASTVVKTFEYEHSTESTDLKLNITCDSLEDDITSLSWNHTNQVLAFGGGSRKISLVQASNGQLLSTFKAV